MLRGVGTSRLNGTWCVVEGHGRAQVFVITKGSQMGLCDDLRGRGLIYQWSSEHLGDLLDHQSIAAYVGFDPTAASLHVGNLLQICNMVRLQRAGHRPIFVAGGGTGMIGDPSGRSEERNLLDPEQLSYNLSRVTSQLERYLDFEPQTANAAVVVDNRSWLSELSMIDFLRDVGKHFNISMMLQKDSVRNRVGESGGFSYTEFSYILLQSYDFYHLNQSDYGVTLQLGGSDQWGNITAGIDFVRRKRGVEVYGLTSPLVTRADGTKFGKSVSGAVWLDPTSTSPFALYQFFVRSDDAMVDAYLKFFTFLSLEEIEALTLESQSKPEMRIAHERLAYEVTAFVHGEDEAHKARRASQLMYSGHLSDADLDTLRLAFSEAPTIALSREALIAQMSVVELMVRSGLATSRGEARRLIGQGGLSINGVRESDALRTIRDDDVLFDQVVVLRRGKRDYCLVEITA